VARIEEVLRKTMGQKCQFRVESLGGADSAAQVQAGETATQPSRYRRQRAEVVQEPLLKRALDVLEAQIVQVDDGFGAAPAPPAERTDAADGEES